MRRAVIRCGGSRRGATLTELLVVIGVVCLLMGLVIPAVMASREASRRAQCASNLRQVALALHGYIASWDSLPSRGTPYTGFSVHSRLLPYLEEIVLYNEINMSLSGLDPSQYRRGNATAAAWSVAAFLCPSDPWTTAAPYGPTSYRANAGTCVYCEFDDTGPFRHPSHLVRPADIIDGLSNTLAFAEKPVGSTASAGYSSFRDWYDLPGSPVFDRVQDWLTRCPGAGARGGAHTGGGRTWMSYGAIYTDFFTIVPPNSPVVDCGSDGVANGAGIFGARSYHPGRVNAALLDGSVRAFSSTTHSKVWSGLGTRAGGEVSAGTF